MVEVDRQWKSKLEIEAHLVAAHGYWPGYLRRVRVELLEDWHNKDHSIPGVILGVEHEHQTKENG